MEDNFIASPSPEGPQTDFEKISYGKAAYKRVQRLRRKGRRRGIDVPTLGFELTKPDKPRMAFWIVAIVSAVLFAGILIATGFLYNELVKIFSDLNGVGDLIRTMFDPKILQGSLGLSALPGILMIFIYILLILLFALPIILAIYFYRFVRDAFYMAKCSKEEFAKGRIITSRIFGIVTFLIVATVIFIFLLTQIAAGNAKVLASVIYVAFLLAFGGLLVLMILEKVKAGKWFDTVEEARKQNYLAHEKALRRIESRLRTDRHLWERIGK